MAKRGTVDMAAETGLLQKPLQENEFDADFLKIMLEVFMRVCRTLMVDDASDPLSKTIVRTVFAVASEGERDPNMLYELALSRFHN